MTHPGPRIGVRPILTADAPALYGCAEAQLTAKVPAACAKLAAVSMLAWGLNLLCWKSSLMLPSLLGFASDLPLYA